MLELVLALECYSYSVRVRVLAFVLEVECYRKSVRVLEVEC